MARDNDKKPVELFEIENGHGNTGRALMPKELLVIAGILAGLLDVDSIFLDREGQVEITLTATIRQKTNDEQIVTLLTSEE